MSLHFSPLLLLLFALIWIYKKGTKRATYLYLSLAFAILALSGPCIKEAKDDLTLAGKEVILALDVSRSMQATDIYPSRLKRAKSIIKEILTQNPHDRFSLFVFTSKPLILAPSTQDHALILSALDALNEANILSHSTNLKALLEKIASLKSTEKNLILLSDGGEERDLKSLLAIANDATIHISPIALATTQGTPLKDQYGKNLKDEHNHLIISRLNPLLKPLAKESGGRFISADSSDFSLSFITKNSQSKRVKKTTIELFWVPLLLCLLLFLFHYIQIPTKFLLLIPFLTTTAESSLLDWYYINQAQNAYHDKHYKKAAKAYEKIEHKTIQSQLNLANSFYHAKFYTHARDIYASIKTDKAKFKKRQLFGLANCEVKLKHFSTARGYYQEALAFGRDEAILHNLALIAHKKDKKDDKIPQTKDTKKVKIKSKSSGKSGKNSKKQAQNGALNSHSHPLGYKAYELINKGYIDEKKPW